MLTSRRKILIEWGHCDPAGIVFNPNYFVWFDACTAGLFAHAGMPHRQLCRTYDFVGIPLVATRARFLLSSAFGEEITIETTVAEFRRSSFDVRHRLLKDGELAVEGFETRVWTTRHPDVPDRLQSRPIPAEVIERLSRGEP